MRPMVVALFRFVPRSFVRWLFRLFRYSDNAVGFGVRYLCLTRLCKACGEKVIVFPSVCILHLENLELSTNISIHEFCYIDAEGSIRIRDDVAIAHGCSILSSDHEIDAIRCSIKDADTISSFVNIDSNVWIGCGVRILKGVHIMSGSVIGAGAVVTRDVAENSIVAGVPVRLIRKRQLVLIQKVVISCCCLVSAGHFLPALWSIKVYEREFAG